jgi:inosose dehydratase
LDEEIRRTCDVLAQLGGTFLVLLDATYRDIFSGQYHSLAQLDSVGWGRLVDKSNHAGRIAKDEFGLELTFHPHADTHVQLLSEVDRLMAETDPDVVSMCLDFGHFEYKGGDSVQLLRNHAARVKYLHLKNVDPVVRERVLAQDIPFGKAVSMRIFCEPSIGVPDFQVVADLLGSFGYEGWATVEQDIYPCKFDEPLPIVRRSIDYLRTIGLVA